MGATLVQSVTGEATASNPTSAAFGVATTPGNRIVIGLVTDHSGGTNATTAASGGGAGSFGLDTSQGTSAGGASISMDFWSAAVATAATTGISFTWSTSTSTHLIWLIQEWANLGVFDKASTVASASSTALLSGSTGTLAQPDSTVFGLGEWRTSSSTSPTVGSGFSNLIQFQSSNGNVMGGALQSQQVSSTSGITSGMTLSPTNIWGALAVAYKNVATARGTQPIVGGMSAAVARASSW